MTSSMLFLPVFFSLSRYTYRLKKKKKPLEVEVYTFGSQVLGQVAAIPAMRGGGWKIPE